MFTDSDGDDESDVGPDALPPDVILDTEAEVACPYCGEKVVISLRQELVAPCGV